MKKLLLATAAVGLSGCSWLGLGQNDKTNTPEYTKYTQPAAPKVAKAAKRADGCCLSRWNIEGAIGPEFFFSGDGITGDKIFTELAHVTSLAVLMRLARTAKSR